MYEIITWTKLIGVKRLATNNRVTINNIKIDDIQDWPLKIII